MLQARTWTEWESSPVAPRQKESTAATERLGVPHGLVAGETLRSVFGPARVVLPHTHNPFHGRGPSGAAWLTNRTLRIEVGSFRWTAALIDITSARDAGGIVEVTTKGTEEPLHLLVPDAMRVAAEIESVRREKGS